MQFRNILQRWSVLKWFRRIFYQRKRYPDFYLLSSDEKHRSLVDYVLDLFKKTMKDTRFWNWQKKWNIDRCSTIEIDEIRKSIGMATFHHHDDVIISFMLIGELWTSHCYVRYCSTRVVVKDTNSYLRKWFFESVSNRSFD